MSCKSSCFLVFSKKCKCVDIKRALSTSIMVGINLLGMGLGFLIPTIVVKEDSIGEKAKK